jgi:hypothetical protein
VAKDELGLRVDGRLGAMDAEAVSLALRALLRLLGPPPADEGAERPVWALSTLAVGSAIVGVRPGGVITAEATERIRIIIRGIEELASTPGEPPGWQPADLENLLAFNRVIGMTGVAGVAFLPEGRTERQVEITGGLLDNARESLAVASVSIGSVRGRLDRWTERGGHREVGLRDEATGRAVTISYAADLQPLVLEALNHDVVIWGEVRRNAQGYKTSVRATGIEVIEYRPAQPVSQLIGVLGDWTAGEDTETFVDWQRRG